MEDIARALNGQHGGIDKTYQIMTERYSRHVAQAVIHILQELNTVQDRAEMAERFVMRKEAGL